MPDQRTRCHWATRALNTRYHDEEWGVPVHDDRRWFEFLILEGAQAGLSWDTVLQKREHYREVFCDFDPAQVAKFDARKIRVLLRDAGIIRNRLKLQASVANARAFLRVQQEYGGFDSFIWRFVGGAPIQTGRKSFKDVPADIPLSIALSKDLRIRGFYFVGPTICYALMQATGIVNDHLVTCFRHREVQALAAKHGVRPD